MMPELGKYMVTVLSSYAASLALLGAVVALTWWQGVRVRRALHEAEERQGKSDG